MENLRSLAQTDQLDRVLENIKSEINNYLHQSIGLGRRMAVPTSFTPQQAVKMQR